MIQERELTDSEGNSLRPTPSAKSAHGIGRTAANHSYGLHVKLLGTRIWCLYEIENNN
jgi:hypothetical protein